MKITYDSIACCRHSTLIRKVKRAGGRVVTEKVDWLGNKIHEEFRVINGKLYYWRGARTRTDCCFSTLVHERVRHYRHL